MKKIKEKKQKTSIHDDIMNAGKRKLAEKLNAPKHKPIALSSSSSETAPNDLGLTSDEIAALKMKRALHKRSSVKDDEELIPDKGISKLMEADQVNTKTITEKERLVRTRNSILQSNKKHFTNIIDIVSKTILLEKKEKEMQKQEQKRKAPQSYDRYQEVQEDSFWKEKLKGTDAEDFQIDTRGSFGAGNLGSIGQTAQTQNKPQTPKSKSPSTSSNSKSSTPQAKRDKDAIPIIVVPSSITTHINLFNAKDFLEDGEFITTVEKKSQGFQKPSQIEIERRKGNSVVKYLVVDNTVKLTAPQWNSVVAVFVLGAEWQFKGWKHSTPVELFANVLGFYVRYEDEAIPQTITSWDVKILNISKQSAKKTSC